MARETVFQVSLPKNAGSVEVNVKSIPDEILDFALEHGFRQKLADIAVNLYVKAARPNPKDTDTVFNNADDLAKAIREKAIALIGRWSAGEWNLEGGGTRRADPVMGEVWSIFFSVLDIPTTKRAEAKKLGMGELALRVAEAKGFTRGTNVENAKAIDAVMTAVHKKAEGIVARRTELKFEL